MEDNIQDIKRIIQGYKRWNLKLGSQNHGLEFVENDIKFGISVGGHQSDQLSFWVYFEERLKFRTPNGQYSIDQYIDGHLNIDGNLQEEFYELLMTQSKKTSAFPLFMLQKEGENINDVIIWMDPNFLWNARIPGLYNRNYVFAHPAQEEDIIRSGTRFFNIWMVQGDETYLAEHVNFKQGNVSFYFKNVPDSIRDRQKSRVYMRGLSEETIELVELRLYEWNVKWVQTAKNVFIPDDNKELGVRNLTLVYNTSGSEFGVKKKLSPYVIDYILGVFKKNVYTKETEIIVTENGMMPVAFCTQVAQVTNRIIQEIYKDEKTRIIFDKTLGFLVGPDKNLLENGTELVLPPIPLRDRIIHNMINGIRRIETIDILDRTPEQITELISFLHQAKMLKHVSHIESCVSCGNQAQWKTKNDDTMFCSKECAKKYYQ